jgi:three-Cys-motif partner protein
MLIHSEAKVEFYKKYLERYLRILYNAPSINEINIFDVFCGTGIYDNGKKGSPVVAFDTIKDLRADKPSIKRINLTVNDSEGEKVSSVKNYIDEANKGYCYVEYKNQSAESMFNEIISTISKQGKNSRNLVFIDPYGYKEIKRNTLEKLLQKGQTEIILFLPISFMHRFTSTAVESEKNAYKALKDFVNSLFYEAHPVTQGISAIEYIDFLKDAFKFNNYYATSYFIERDESNYFALFFITPHIYGLDRILSVKWALDEEAGRGFRQPVQELTPSLFAEQDKQLRKNDTYERLERVLKEALKTPKTNLEIYEIVLKKEFQPKHATEIFNNWQKNLSNFKVVEIENNKPARAGNFYISWNHYKENKPKVRFTLT